MSNKTEAGQERDQHALGPTSSGSPASGSDLPAWKAEKALQAELAALKIELQRVQAELTAVKGSTIWRLSAVIRGPVMLLMRLRHGYRMLPGEVARRGGLLSHVCEWAREVRSYGWGYFGRINTYELNPGPGSGEHDRNDYAAWVGRAPAPLRAQPAPVKYNGLLSVVLPVYRPPLDLLKEAIASVLSQSYPHWELCIADDASADGQLDTYLRDLAAGDKRIRVNFRPQNGHISACSNSALSMASGEFIVLLDQDDLLAPGALERVALCIDAHPDAAIIYSDEDRIDESGQVPLGSYFKPDFNYDLFLGHNLISHLGVYRKSLVDEVGGFRVGLEGSQDWDLALRVLELAGEQRVHHIPEVLYHWRAIQGSTALDQAEKSYTSSASRRAIQDHLDRTGVSAEVVPARLWPAFNRVVYQLEADQRSASVLVLFDGTPAQLQHVVAELDRTKGSLHCDFLIATPAPLDEAAIFANGTPPDVRLRTIPVPRRASMAQRIDALLPHAEGHFLILVTIPLTAVSHGTLDDLCRIAAQPRSGFVAPRIIDGAGHEDIFDHGGVVFSDTMRAVYAHKGLFAHMTGYAGRAILQQRFTALSPAVLAIRRERLAGHSQGPTGHPGFGGPLDLIDQAMTLHGQGLHNIWTPDVEMRFLDLRYAGKANLLLHLGLFGSRRRAWVHKWGKRPYESSYNPNLSPDGDFALNWRTR